MRFDLSIWSLPALMLILFSSANLLGETVDRWSRFEIAFQSQREYDNPLYDVPTFRIVFESPSGREISVDGFWDGGLNWKARFMPDEAGLWKFRSVCSDKNNSGLHSKEGQFSVRQSGAADDLSHRGPIVRQPGRYYLTYSDGTPFFWTADTAWNGALKSTEEEWETYLSDRRGKGFNVIQFVTTQWRGCETDIDGRVAFTGSGRIAINPDFFHRMDQKVDRINAHGLVAAPVLLWTLQTGSGRHLSPGYSLPTPEAILLAKYIVSRYVGNNVVWILGGDGRYLDEYQQRWKTIGRAVFEGETDTPGIVLLHPCGLSWIGEAFKDEDWLDLVGYQSSHSKAQRTVDWINKGPVSKDWYRLPARPIVNLEPIYEQILEDATERDVRTASYWSVFAAPPAGISYGANGIWPWLRKGEKILNHRDAPWTSDWRTSLDLPGCRQICYLSRFMQGLEWWRLRPAHQKLLVDQPGEADFRSFVPVLATDDCRLILVYLPSPQPVALRNNHLRSFSAEWFDPVQNALIPGGETGSEPVMKFSPQPGEDRVLVLRAE